MVSEAATGDVMDLPGIPEDTIDLGERLDPVRTLLRRTAGGDRRAAGALLDVLGPRIHGLAVHVTGSAARASALTVSVLRSCLRDAAELAASGLPGEAAVLDLSGALTSARVVVGAGRGAGWVRRPYLGYTPALRALSHQYNTRRTTNLRPPMALVWLSSAGT